MKKISIIIACHNCADTVPDTWTSLKDQSIGIDHLECVFVDDASDDDGKTWQALVAIEAQAPNSVLIVHLDENLRQGGARNVGISYANGKYLQFLDADDTLTADACQILYDTAESRQADIIQFNHLFRLGDQEKVMTASPVDRDYLIETADDRIPFLNTTTVTYGCTNKFYRMDLIREAQARFSEHRVYEEPLFVYPLFLYAKRITCIPAALYIYNLHPDSTVTSAIGARLLDHPQVQLELLAYCMERPELYQQFRDVIGVYFLWTYYCETLCFAVENNAQIPLEFFQGMQQVCRRFFPDWRDNPQLRMVDRNTAEVLESIDRNFSSQEELNSFTVQAGSLLKN